MGKSALKYNLPVDEEVYKNLEKLVPSAKRKEVVSEALRKELELIRRKKSVNRLMNFSKKVRTLSSEYIQRRLDSDRRTHR